jgi:hypothetical protein
MLTYDIDEARYVKRKRIWIMVQFGKGGFVSGHRFSDAAKHDNSETALAAGACLSRHSG